MSKSARYTLLAVFSFFFTVFFSSSIAQEHNEANVANEKTEKKIFDANEVIFGHVLDAHEFHFFTYKGSDGEEHHVTIPLPVILYSPQKGIDIFMSSRFHHGEHSYKGYSLLTEEKAVELSKARGKRFSAGQIVAVKESGAIDENIKVYDFSLTRNVVQMFLALILLCWLLIAMTKRYRTGQGITTAPKGMQNVIEPIVTFFRDEVAKPNLGTKYEKYFPYLLTVFFFILINSMFGLLPGTANVTGNIAFTAVLGVISFIVITISGNKHYWGHIANPPVPFGIKFIMVPVEILGIFTKPFALIIRLFANMLAGHIIIICLVSLIFIFGGLNKGIGWGFSPVSIAFAVFIYLIEVLVAFIQAFIFTNLTAVFIGQAIEETHHTEEQHQTGGGTVHYDDPVII